MTPTKNVLSGTQNCDLYNRYQEHFLFTIETFTSRAEVQSMKKTQERESCIKFVRLNM